MPEFNCLDPLELERFLDRRRAKPNFPLELSLAENLTEVLRRANEFVPSAAGSILLDNPATKWEDRLKGSLTFIAAFGERSHELVGKVIPASEGIAGHVYLTGTTYCSHDVRSDRFFYPDVDADIEYTTESLIAIPVRIEKSVCGVLELINRQHASGYSEIDRNLLEIFAGYIAISIQNVLDGRQAQEIAKRDNLTGLYNDRYLHIALSHSIENALERDHDLAVVFLDLDRFKNVNDTHGHLAGSQVLREFGQLLKRCLRSTKDMAARYGGDEFVLVLPETDLDAAVEVAERVRQTMPETIFSERPGEIQPEPLHLTGLTCSIGVASLRRHVTDGSCSSSVETCKSTLLRLADSAMYVAKETGRDRTAVAGESALQR